MIAVMNLHYQVEGAGVPIVMTSGMGDSSEAWSPLFESLQRQGKALRWDLRGHGRSELSSNPADYSAGSACHDLLRMITAAGGGAGFPAILIGHSLGGYLSLSVAIDHPTWVQALVLIATGPGFRSESSRSQWNQQVMTMSLRGVMHPLARRVALQADDRVIDGLKKVEVPTLIVVGSEDRSFLKAAEFLAAEIPDSTSVVVKGARHSVHRSHPGAVNEAILDFLNGIEGKKDGTTFA